MFIQIRPRNIYHYRHSFGGTININFVFLFILKKNCHTNLFVCHENYTTGQNIISKCNTAILFTALLFIALQINQVLLIPIKHIFQKRCSPYLLFSSILFPPISKLAVPVSLCHFLSCGSVIQSDACSRSWYRLIVSGISSIYTLTNRFGARHVISTREFVAQFCT